MILVPSINSLLYCLVSYFAGLYIYQSFIIYHVFVQVFHPGHASGGNDPVSWTEPYFEPDQSYWKHRSNKSWMSVDEDEAEKYPLPDTQSANAATEQLKKFAESQTPFFLAVGFHKPHLPFQFPSRFLDLYPVDSVKLPDNPFAPANMPEVELSRLYCKSEDFLLNVLIFKSFTMRNCTIELLFSFFAIRNLAVLKW